MTKPKVQHQGTIIAEEQPSSEWLVLLPDGVVHATSDKAHAEQVARRWFKAHTGKNSIGVGFIEWRPLRARCAPR